MIYWNTYGGRFINYGELKYFSFLKSAYTGANKTDFLENWDIGINCSKDELPDTKIPQYWHWIFFLIMRRYERINLKSPEIIKRHRVLKRFQLY